MNPDIQKSLFSLVKYNNGAFKSEKQATFLLSKSEEGMFVFSQSLHFGEYDARTARNTARMTWIFYADALGVYKVEKETGKKGLSVYWERSEASAAASEANKAKREQQQAIHAKAETLTRLPIKWDKKRQAIRESYLPLLETIPHGADLKDWIKNNPQVKQRSMLASIIGDRIERVGKKRSFL